MEFEEETSAPCPDLVEVLLFAPQQGKAEADFLLAAEARFGTMSIAIDDGDQLIEFGLARGILRLVLAGCEISPGQRFGDQEQATLLTKVSKTSAQSIERRKSAGASGLLASSAATSSAEAKGSLAISGKADRSRRIERTEQVEQQLEKKTSPVLSMSGHRWEFSALGGDVMKSRFSGGETLCKIEVEDRTSEIRGVFYFFPKDIVLFDGETDGFSLTKLLGKSPSKKSVAKLLISKYLNSLNNDAKMKEEASGGIVAALAKLRIAESS